VPKGGADLQYRPNRAPGGNLPAVLGETGTYRRLVGSADVAGWNADNAAGSPGANAVTLLVGSSFCISTETGDIFPDRPHGAFFNDTRFISLWHLRVNAEALEPLTAASHEPYKATFIASAASGSNGTDTALLVERTRHLGRSVTETITVRNYSPTPVTCDLMLDVDADFADLFEVKERRPARIWSQSRRVDGDVLYIESTWQTHRHGLAVTAPGGVLRDGRFAFVWWFPGIGTGSGGSPPFRCSMGHRRRNNRTCRRQRPRNPNRNTGSRPGERRCPLPILPMTPSRKSSSAAKKTSAHCG
jgi:hypothetical protein